MEKRFIVPAVTMLTGIILFTAFLVTYLTSNWKKLSLWFELALGLFIGGLIVFSGTRCRRVDGPRLGNIVRTAVLLIMVLLSFWKIGILVAVLFLIAAMITGFFAATSSAQTNEVGRSI